jgi:hypothetical protein
MEFLEVVQLWQSQWAFYRFTVMAVPRFYQKMEEAGAILFE